ncbi:MAG: hypothetical protein IPM69_01090 [Ignavibacteria bacterium]|nr:hypothetical protein [Ignavibacteria bacterium]
MPKNGNVEDILLTLPAYSNPQFAVTLAVQAILEFFYYFLIGLNSVGTIWVVPTEH